MTKAQYLNEIRNRLAGLPESDINKRLEYYSEMIDDRMEEGLSEEEAVDDMDTPIKVASDILAEIPLTRIVEEKIKPKKSLNAWEVILLLLGAPIWFPLLLSVFIIGFSVVIALSAVVFSIYLTILALGFAGIICVIGFIGFLFGGKTMASLFTLGVGLCAFGLFMFGTSFAKPLAVSMMRIIRGFFNSIKRVLAGKR